MEVDEGKLLLSMKNLVSESQKGVERVSEPPLNYSQGQRSNKIQGQFQPPTNQNIITSYLTLQVAALDIYYQPSCMDADGGDGSCHRATKYSQFGSTFTGKVRAKVRNIKINCNKFILMVLLMKLYIA